MIPKLLETARKDSVLPRLVIVASDMDYKMLIDILIPNVRNALTDLDAS